MLDSPPAGSTAQNSVSHAQAAAQLGANIPHFFGDDIVQAYRPVYLTADFLYPVGARAPFFLKYIIYRLLLPKYFFIIWRVSSSYPPPIAAAILRGLGL